MGRILDRDVGPNTLVVSTTHVKMGWLQRNGAPTSDLTTMEERFIRHGDYLMVATFVNDPVYLSEPFIRTTNFRPEPHRKRQRLGLLRTATDR